jgi:hypothetical protein
LPFQGSRSAYFLSQARFMDVFNGEGMASIHCESYTGCG